MKRPSMFMEQNIEEITNFLNDLLEDFYNFRNEYLKMFEINKD